MSRRSRAGQTRRLTRSWRTRASHSVGCIGWYRFYITRYRKGRAMRFAADFPADLPVRNAARAAAKRGGMTSTTATASEPTAPMAAPLQPFRLARRRPPHRRRRRHRAPASGRPVPRRRDRLRAHQDRVLPRRLSRARLEARRRRGAARGDADRRGALLAHLVVSPARVRRLHGRSLRTRWQAPRMASVHRLLNARNRRLTWIPSSSASSRS